MKTYHHRVIDESKGYEDWAIDAGGAATLSPSRPITSFGATTDNYQRMLEEIAAGTSEVRDEDGDIVVID